MADTPDRPSDSDRSDDELIRDLQQDLQATSTTPLGESSDGDLEPLKGESGPPQAQEP